MIRDAREGASVCRGLDFWGASVWGGLLAILDLGGASVSETNQHDSFIIPVKMDFFFSDKKKMLYYVDC